MFTLYAHWVYSNELDTTLVTEPPGTPDAPTWPPSHLNLGKMWITASYLGDTNLCNRVVDHWLEKLDSMPGNRASADSLSYIFDNSAPGSVVQQLLVDVTAARSNEQCFYQNADQYPRELITALARKYMAGDTRGKTRAPSFSDRCKYDIHSKDEPKCGE